MHRFRDISTLVNLLDSRGTRCHRTAYIHEDPAIRSIDTKLLERLTDGKGLYTRKSWESKGRVSKFFHLTCAFNHHLLHTIPWLIHLEHPLNKQALMIPRLPFCDLRNRELLSPFNH
jgi:hypothetical protein